jgi:hypothetical protein
METVGETVIYRFAPLSGNAFIRVQNPDNKDAVTYWDWKSSKADGAEIVITDEVLFMNDSGEDKYDSNTVYRTFEKFEMDLGDNWKMGLPICIGSFGDSWQAYFTGWAMRHRAMNTCG